MDADHFGIPAKPGTSEARAGMQRGAGAVRPHSIPTMAICRPKTEEGEPLPAVG